MNFDSLPDDFFVTSHQFTKTAYRDVYPSIDPSSSNKMLSQAGKVIVITGASKGIGRYGLAKAFARAHAKAIVLVARDADRLAQTQQDIARIDPDVKVVCVPTDLGSESSVQALFEKIKKDFGTKVDVLVNNAGSANSMGPLDQIDSKTWWADFELNVLGTFHVTRAFLQLVGSEQPATIINITSGAAVAVTPMLSAYAISKLAMMHMQQFVTAEHPNVIAISASPGTVSTDMVLDSFKRFAKDTPDLIGGFTLWLTTDQAKFLNGRYVCANWSVDELVQRRDEIVGQEKLLTGLNVKLGKENISEGK